MIGVDDQTNPDQVCKEKMGNLQPNWGKQEDIDRPGEELRDQEDR